MSLWKTLAVGGWGGGRREAGGERCGIYCSAVQFGKDYFAHTFLCAFSYYCLPKLKHPFPKISLAVIFLYAPLKA